VGSARSALFNWLYAEATGGEMILRIEDTDAALRKPEFIDAIVKPLSTLGITWTEGPYYQSQRQQFHVDAVEQLVASGSAYFCNLTRDEADALAAEAGLPSGYHGWSRDKGIEDGAVDDADMGITHVIRGEDLLNTTPKIMLLWDALDLGEKPQYAHLPLLVNAQRKKLSKRRDDVSLMEFLSKGYLPEAMVNHLALLGWGPPDDKEIRPIEEIISLFKLENVNKGSAFFDVTKLDHINGDYIRALDVDDFIAKAEPFVYGLDTEIPWDTADYKPEVFALVAADVQQRVNVLSEIPRFIEWLFVDEVSYDLESKAWNKAMRKGKMIPEILDGLIEAFAEVEWTADALNAVAGFAEAAGHVGPLWTPVARWHGCGADPWCYALQEAAANVALEHTPPQLSDDGAQILADVLAARTSRIRAESNLSPAGEQAVAPTRQRTKRTAMLMPLLVVLGGLGAALVVAVGIQRTPVSVEVAGVSEQREVVEQSDQAFVVAVERVDPAVGAVRLLDLSIASPPSSEAVRTDRFEVRAQDAAGLPVLVISRFSERSLESGHSLLVTLRIEGADRATTLDVLLDGAVIERVDLG